MTYQLPVTFKRLAILEYWTPGIKLFHNFFCDYPFSVEVHNLAQSNFLAIHPDDDPPI